MYVSLSGGILAEQSRFLGVHGTGADPLLAPKHPVESRILDLDAEVSSGIGDLDFARLYVIYHICIYIYRCVCLNGQLLSETQLDTELWARSLPGASIPVPRQPY